MSTNPTTRPRKRNELRDTFIEPFPTAAPGSVIIRQGGTKVLCTASVSTKVPPWLGDPVTGEATQGWVTAEYNMLPGSTPERKARRSDGRSTEIQRLIGRSLRAAVDLEKMPGLMITCDCDVLAADGGTRTAATTGAFVALAQAVEFARANQMLQRQPVLGPVAAVSVGIVNGQPHLDLDYDLDSQAQVDMNVVMNHRDQYIEIQGTGEQGTFSRAELDQLLELAGRGIRKLIRLQRATLRAI